ncbi:MAG TPA: ABC transporter substrate-binding protein [Actinomycetota bacterium]|nr:ABC transporter substrate-binding protein [Actinomycetota bacterium]
MSNQVGPAKGIAALAGWKLTAAFVAGALVGAVSAVQMVPNFRGTSADGTPIALEDATGSAIGGGGSGRGALSGAGGAKGAGGAGGTGPAAIGGGGGARGGGVLPPGRAGLECAPGGNGGATDQGVTGSEIKMATTVAESGPGAAFLGEVRFGMDAVVAKVNAAGGICGRKLVIQYVDDAWDAQKGAQYLRNFIQQRIFAIPVGPSSEGLRVVIDSGDIDRSRIPVVGTDGMLQNQYTRSDGSAQPWVWPVAAATVSSARIMVQEAYKRGARDFSIVFDKNYRFGVEAAEAFNAEVKRLTGKPVPGYNSQYTCQEQFCGIIAGRTSYSADVATFEEGDFVALFVEPGTGLAWMNDPNAKKPSDVKYGYGAAQPLFTREFAENCKSKCDQMRVWTGFKPPIEGYANDPAVKQYVEDLKRTKPDADEYNAFTQGGYIGMMLLVDALKMVGPDLTRDRLKAALDHISLKTGLTLQSSLPFTPSSRFANTTMQAFTIQYKGTFGGWRSGPIVRDVNP